MSSVAIGEMAAVLPRHDAPRSLIEALRRPEMLVDAWENGGSDARTPYLMPRLMAVTVAATAAYGLTMGLPIGVDVAIERALAFPLACGIAWSIALPTFFVLGALNGMRLRPSTMLLIAVVTVHYGGLAMLASIPVQLLFAVALPYPAVSLGINLVIFAGVGLSTGDVLRRVVNQVAPDSIRFAEYWLVLLGVLGPELFLLFNLFEF